MEIALDAVVVRKRLRTDLGDIEALMQSMRRYGQLQPIVLNRRRELVAGFRRLEAARRLGWRSIQAVVVECESEAAKLELEIEENVQRQNLPPDEIADALERLRRLVHPGLLTRLWRLLVRFLRRLGFGGRPPGA